MKQKLSKREMFLIGVAGVFVVGFILFHFIIGPIQNYYNTRLDEYERLSVEKEIIDFKLQNEAAYLAAYEIAGRTFDKISELYPMQMPNEDVDKILTGLCLQNNLSPTLLGMSDATEVTFEKKNAQEAQQEGAESSEGAEQAAQGQAAFVVVTANMNLSGSYEALKSLIDTVGNMDYIRIGQVTFTNQQGAGWAGSSNISVNFEVTMLKERT